MGYKPVDAVPGIGLVYREKLKVKNIDTAKKLYAHFIITNMDFSQFTVLMGDIPPFYSQLRSLSEPTYL